MTASTDHGARRATAALLVALLTVTALVAAPLPAHAALGDMIAVQESRLLPPIPPGSNFGSAVAIDGSRAVVAAEFFATTEGAAFLYERDAGGRWNVVASLRPDDPFNTTLSASSVAIDGDTIAFGATYHDGTDDVGAVYVFRVGEDGVTQEQRIPDPDLRDGASFGREVVLDGDTLVVGSRDAVGPSDSVDVFERTGTTWSHTDDLVPTGAVSGAYGQYLDIDGDRIVAADFSAGTDGVVHVFEREVSGWVETTPILPPAAGPSPNNGTDVGTIGDAQISGDLVAISLTGRDVPTGDNVGAAVILDLDTDTVVAEVTASTATAPFNGFPGAIDLDGEILVASGDWLVTDAADNDVFVFEGPSWGETDVLASAASDDNFGAAVATDGSRVLVGAPTADDLGIADLGAVAVHVPTSGGVWEVETTLVGTEAEAASRLGEHVTTDTGRMYVSAGSLAGAVSNTEAEIEVFEQQPDGTWQWYERLILANRFNEFDVHGTRLVVDNPIGSGTNDASVLVLERSGGPSGTWSEVAEVRTADYDTTNTQFGREVALEGDRMVVGAPEAPEQTTGDASGQVHVFDRDGTGTWVETTLDKPGSRNSWGSDVALSGDVIAVSGSSSDIVDVFRRDGGGVWQHEDALVTGLSAFCVVIALEGDRLVVGAPDLSPGTTIPDDPGVVQVYEHVGGGVWDLEDTLASDQDVPGNRFGQSVAIDGDVLVVGEPGRDDGARSRVGGFTYFTRNPDATWEPEAAFSPPAVPDDTHAGMAIAVAGGQVALGAHFLADPLRDLPGSTYAGAAFAVRVTADPVAVDDDFVTPVDTTLVVAEPQGVLANDTDPGGDTLTAALVDDVTDCVLTLNGDGSFTYDPDPGFFGIDQFTYTADNTAPVSSNLATVSILVSRTPIANDDAYAAPENTGGGAGITVSVGTGVLSNDTDPDGDAMTATLVDDVSRGTLTLAADGSFTYVPAVSWTGVDTFTYTADDPSGSSAPATVSITVSAAPTAVDDAYETDEDTALVVPADGVLANDTDPEPDPLAAVLESGPTNGDLSLSGDGSFTYTPDPDFEGVDTFTYRASDGPGLSNIATVEITVYPVADTTADAYAVDEGQTLAIDAANGVLSNDSVEGGGTLTAALATDVTGGTLALAGDGSFTYTPNAGTTGDQFTYTASTTETTSAPTTVTITVAPADPDPDPDPEPDPDPKPEPAGNDEVTRCAGSNRIATAVCVSALTFDDAASGAPAPRATAAVGDRIPAKGAVLARANDFADALAGTPFAYEQQAPLLLTSTSTLSVETADEIDRVLGGSGTVWLLGGEAAISADVATALTAAGYDVERLSGDNRYETAVTIARATTPTPGAVLITTGTNFADAVSAGPAAIARGGTIVLSNGDQAASATLFYLAELGGSAELFAIGGPAARAHPTATPVFGDNRVATSVEVAETFFTDPPAIGVARHDQFADSLSGGLHVGRLGGPLLLTPTASLSDVVATYLEAARAAIDDAFVYGGDAAIAATVADEIKALIAD